MDSVAVTVPFRLPAKKMKKRKELDALALPRAISRRSSGKRSSQELLSDSSDEPSEYWNVSSGRGGARKIRDRESERSGVCTSLLQTCNVFLAGTIVLMSVVLVWLFTDVRQQLTVFRAELDQVITGSEGVPDALQTCHTLDKNVKENLTHVTDEIQKLNRSLCTFSEQVSNLQQELQQVQISLKSAPELTSVPNTVKALQNSIGELEINIHDLQTTYKKLKNDTLNLKYSQDQQIQNLTMIEEFLRKSSTVTQPSQAMSNNETLIERNKLWESISELRKNLKSINQTLTMNITWAQEDLSNDHKKIVSLQDMTQNTSTQILTLQQECIKKKDYEILQNIVQSVLNQVNKLSSKTINQEVPQTTDEKFSIQNSNNTSSSIDASLIHSKSETVTSKTIKQSSVQKKLQKVESTTNTSYKPASV